MFRIVPRISHPARRARGLRRRAAWWPAVPLGALLLGALLLGGCINVPLGAKRPVVYHNLGGSGEAVVYLMRVDGVITAERALQNTLTGRSVPSTVEQVRFQLDRLNRDGVRPAGVIVRINSPGGTVTASDIIYYELARYKRRHGIPVVVLMMDVATSGGYYVAMAADAIVAHPTTTTGSLGVIMPAYNVSRLMAEHGVEDRSIASGPLKDLLSPTRPVRPEHERVVQGVVDDLYARFMDVVRQGRGDRLKRPLEQLADGRIFTARQALDAGLVDRVGYIQDAMEVMRQRARVPEFRLITLAEEPETGAPNVYMAEAGHTPPQGISSWLGLSEPLAAPFYYLWYPH